MQFIHFVTILEFAVKEGQTKPITTSGRVSATWIIQLHIFLHVVGYFPSHLSFYTRFISRDSPPVERIYLPISSSLHVSTIMVVGIPLPQNNGDLTPME